MTKELDYYTKRSAGIINKILYITIATVCDDGQPWNSPVYSAFDEQLNFFWISDKDAQHSLNIRNNRPVFLVIYDSTVPEGTGEGVYIQAIATELIENDEINKGYSLTQIRAGATIKEDNHPRFTGEAVRRVYKAVPQRIWTNADETDKQGKFLRDIRLELSIAEVTKAMRPE